SLKENLGFCGAVNLGIQKTKTPYLILLNNDTEADRHFVEKLLAGIKKSERIFSCGAQMIDFKNHEMLDNAGDLYTAMGWAVARGKGKKCEDFEQAVRVFSCCAGAAIYRMDVLKKIGGLDEQHFAYLEDVDLGYRARIDGFENWYTPEAKVYHVGSATTGTRYNEKKVFLAARNTIFVIYKNMPLLQLFINLPFILAGMIVKTLFFVKKGFVKDYWSGICEGVRDCHKCRKVSFAGKNLSHYLKIQLELWGNIGRILGT
ncbi:MAG: glycosyltransferase family 2 protein, partial [Acetivibrio ethanolgignens]